LLLVPGIVEDQQNPPFGEQGTEQRGLGVHVLRYSIRPCPERTEEAAERLIADHANAQTCLLRSSS
jgi:hypothetical protein